MISNDEAIQNLEESVRNGAILVVAAHADLPSVKRLLHDCLLEGIPAMLGPCAAGG